MKTFRKTLTTALLFVGLLVLAAAPIMAVRALPATAPTPVLSAPHVATQAQDDGGLTEAQVFLVGIVASAFLWVLKLLVSRGYQPSKEVVAIALYVVASGMALLFKAVTLPPFPPFADAPTFVAALLDYIGGLLTLAAPIAGMAYLIYNLFLKRVLEGGAAKLGIRLPAKADLSQG